MRILCDACGAKYQVDDDKVRNRSFKFPCKKCGHTVIVRKASEENNERIVAAEAEAADVAGAFEETKQLNYDQHLAQQAKEEGAIWYVAVGQERVGPVSADDVQAYIDQEQVTDASYVWSEGMDDWAPLGDVPALARLLPSSLAAPAGNPFQQPDSLGSDGAPDSQSNPFSEPAFAEGAGDGAVAADSDLLVSDHGEATFDEPGDSPVVSTAQLMGQRHENSVLFSLDSLDNDDGASDGLMRPSATQNTEGSGLIDLAMLGGETDNLDKIFNPAAPASVPMGAPIKPMASLVTQPRSNRTGLIVGGAVFAGLVCVGGILGGLYYWDKSRTAPPVQAPVQQTEKPTKAEQPVAAKTKVAPTPTKSAVLASKTPSNKEAPKAAVKSEPPKSDTAPKGVRVATQRQKAAMQRAMAKRKARSQTARRSNTVVATKKATPSAAAKPIVQPKKTIPAPKPAKRKKSGGTEAERLLAALDGGGTAKAASKGASKPSNSPPKSVDPLLPATISRAQVLGAVRRNMARVRSCKRLDPDISGKVTVRFVISGSGRVSSAIPMGPLASSKVGRCVAGKVRAIRFPRFSGKPITIGSFPFTL